MEAEYQMAKHIHNISISTRTSSWNRVQFHARTHQSRRLHRRTGRNPRRHGRSLGGDGASVIMVIGSRAVIVLAENGCNGQSSGKNNGGDTHDGYRYIDRRVRSIGDEFKNRVNRSVPTGREEKENERSLM